MTPHIRRATPSDAIELATLAARTFPLACPPGTSEEDIADFVATVFSVSAFETYVADPQRVVLVADDADALVGYAMLVLSPPTDSVIASALTVAPSVEVNKMYVDPRSHGAGVAGALMDAAADQARELGRSALWLGVNQQNARAQAFYSRTGFHRVGTRQFALGDVLHDDFVMQREL